VEFVALGNSSQSFIFLASPQPSYTEYSELRVFALHPGTIQTRLLEETVCHGLACCLIPSLFRPRRHSQSAPERQNDGAGG
jgi:hypothetical protein